MSERGRAIITSSLRAAVRDLDVETLSPAEAIDLVDWFTELERLAAAGKTIAAGRALDGEPWRTTGERSGADWLARRTATTVGEARDTLATAANLSEAPRTDAAFRKGTLSPKQADAVAAAAAADPAQEQRLLDTAAHESLQTLRDESARVRAAADPDPSSHHERIHRGRYWRRWTDREGARCGAYRMTPEAAAKLEAAAQPFIDAAIDDARRDGRHEPTEAHAADGLVALATSHSAAPTARGGRGRRRLKDRRELIALVDLEALLRGTVEPGELCEIAGVGPVPVDVARRVFGDALLRIVIRNGVDIRTVVHTGRTASAVQETAVLVRDGGRCIRPTCGRPAAEIDHLLGFTVTRVTTLDDLGGVCGTDHDNKTLRGHTYRRDAAGVVEWVLPDGTVERGRPPP
jgi:hypothetical protein